MIKVTKEALSAVMKEVLSAVMKKASKNATGRSILPIYNHVALSSDGVILTITASDGVRTYVDMIDVTGDKEEYTLEAVKLARAINGMKSGDIEITSKGVKQGKTSIKLESMAYDTFPVPNFDKGESCGLSYDEFLSACNVVSHALPVKDVRAMLRGVHLTDGNIVATDGARLAYVESKYKGPDVIVPTDTIKSLPSMEGDVCFSANQMIIKSEKSIFASSLVDAKYPDWKRILPRDHTIEVSANAQDLIDAIKTVSIGGDIVKLKISKEGALLSNDGAQTECAIKSDGEIEIGFMCQFLLDALGQCMGDITIKLGHNKACLIEDNFVIMPVRI